LEASQATSEVCLNSSLKRSAEPGITEPGSQIVVQGYLISQYPAINHTYILREIHALRRLGMRVSIVAIRAADRPHNVLAPEEQEEAARTFYVNPAGIARMLLDHLATALTNPAGYARGLACAIATARLDLIKSARHLAYFAQAVVAGRYFTRERVSHVHAHYTSTVALFLSRVFPITFSATIHGPAEFNDSKGFLLPEKVQAASFICAISNYSRSQLARVSPAAEWSKIEVVPLGVDPAVFEPPPFRPEHDRLEVACVATLGPEKGQRVLIEAIDHFVREGRSVRLRLVGHGPDRSALEQYVRARALQDYVVFEGALKQSDVLAIYRDTDVFALASFAEGVPVVLMEAMAMEIPCVATWVNGIPELIRNEQDGLLVPPADELALARALARLHDDPALCERLGKSARLRVIAQYDLETNVARLAAVFRKRLV
jgi:glycosyltransferase involved in cell wall biosynthesis